MSNRDNRTHYGFPALSRFLLDNDGQLIRRRVIITDYAHDAWCARPDGGPCTCCPDISRKVWEPK